MAPKAKPAEKKAPEAQAPGASLLRRPSWKDAKVEITPESIESFLNVHEKVDSKRFSICVPPEALDGEEGIEADDDLDEEVTPAAASTEARPIEEAAVSGQDTGVLWHVKVVTDDFNDPKVCLPSGDIKPRRPEPTVKVSKLLSGLRQDNGRWIFAMPLNDWPALSALELTSITKTTTSGLKMVKVVKRTRTIWKTGMPLPQAKDINCKGIRAVFTTPPWAKLGWSPESPGFVWWFTEERDDKPIMAHGEQILRMLEKDRERTGAADAKIAQLAAFAHRYPVKADKETARDRNTYHTGCLVEWSHQRFCTLIEMAWKNGCGGYNGKSNWCQDLMEPVTKIYQAMPPGMKAPWNTGLTEIRFIDMPVKTCQEFETYLENYSNRNKELPFEQQRFLNPCVYARGTVRLRSCTPIDLAGYCLNYVSRVSEYHQLTANCQTFTTDLFAFLCGQKDIKPYGTICKPGYRQRTHAFLYVP